MPQARLSESTYSVVARLSSETGKSQQEILDQAVKLFERAQFFAELNAGFEQLSDAERAEIDTEREEWDITLQDSSV